MLWIDTQSALAKQAACGGNGRQKLYPPAAQSPSPLVRVLLPDSAVECVGTLEAYLARPIGRCLLGPSYAVWWHSASLNGLLLWDRPDEEHIHRITSALDAELFPNVQPHASLVDCRRVRAVDLGAFTALTEYVEQRRIDFARVVTRQALVRPEGLPGAAVAGFYAVLAPSYPVDVFTDPEAAFRWLGADRQSAVAEELDAIHATATGASSVVVALRAYIEQRHGEVTLKEAAHALEISPRQLQRKLRDASTCFQQEDQAARIRVAKNLLLETNYDVKRIAIEVGCASPQHFGVLFRKVVGTSPTQWRAGRR